MKTRITELTKTRYPIIQGGMQWVGTAEIRRCRGMTDQPFGVNLTVLPTIDPPPYAEYVEAVISIDGFECAGHPGEVDGGLVWAGQGVGLIDDIPSCAELLERMVADCRTHLQSALRLACV